MQLLLEFFPVVAFVVAYYLGGIYVATATLMATMVLSLGISWLRTRRIPPMLGASTALVLVLGAATLILRNNRFIQWKPSIFMWLLAIAFLVSIFVGRQTLAQRLLQPTLGDVQLERREWRQLTFAWVAYGLIIGLVNIIVAYHASESTWVAVKSFGIMGSMFLFLLGQVYWLHRRGKLPA
ncbi:MAG: inner membrane-spanning protein YciB [Steroidobacteraceae bacterium]